MKVRANRTIVALLVWSVLGGFRAHAQPKYSVTELGKILAQLVEGGIQVTQFREEQTDLEEAFMSFARPSEPKPAATIAAGGVSHG